jgi:thiol-disulfide isomerase/thioredoxin
MVAGGVALAAALVFQGWFLLQLFYQNGRLLLRVDTLEQQLAAAAAGFAPSGQIEEGLPVGAPAPDLSLRTVDGEPAALPGVRAGVAPKLVLFVDPHCGPCKDLVPEIARWQRDYSDRFELLLISRGAPEVNRASYSAQGIERVLLQENREAAEAFQVTGTPAALMVNPDGRVGSPLALGADQIRMLVSLSSSRPTMPLQAHAGCGCGRAGEVYAS